MRPDTHTAAKHYALVSTAQNAALSLSLSLASHTHTNRQAQIQRDIHVHTHTHMPVTFGFISRWTQAGFAAAGLFVSVCETLSLGCVCGTCCRLVRYVNGKRDVGNAFIQTSNTHTHTHTTFTCTHIKKTCGSGGTKATFENLGFTFKIWK